MKFKVQSSKFKVLLFSILYTLYSILYTFPQPVYAKVDIGTTFGFGDIQSLSQGTNKLVVPVFSIAAGLVVLYFVFGAFDYITAGGNKEGIDKAKKKITEGIIGFIILMFAFLVLQFILHSLLNIEQTDLPIIG